MKIVAIGDIHGRDIWKSIVETEKDADMFVFVGDYYDSHRIPAEKIHINFREILEFKVKNPKKVTLLVGNHDMHYLPFAKQKCSGYDPKVAMVAGMALHENLKNGSMQMALLHDEYLFTHAGVTSTWLDKTGFSGEKMPLDKFLNELVFHRSDLFEYQGEDTSGYGEHIGQSPIWVRPESLKKDCLQGIYHVIGHTTFDNILVSDTHCNNSKLFLIDSPKNREYLVIEDGNVAVGAISSKKATI